MISISEILVLFSFQEFHDGSFVEPSFIDTERRYKTMRSESKSLTQKRMSYLVCSEFKRYFKEKIIDKDKNYINKS